MDFSGIKAKIASVALETTRADNENYFEAVMAQASLGEMVRVLESIFGAPAWPSGAKLSKDTEKFVKSVGGLRKGQTLYLLNTEECSAFAMLWPWASGERITIKISKVKGQ